nr:hypothetical protein Iba_chr09dCG3660 [Ipomoea batatas]
MNVLCDELSERLDLEIPRRQRDDEGTVERERALLPELCPAPLRYADDYVHVPRPLARKTDLDNIDRSALLEPMEISSYRFADFAQSIPGAKGPE